MQIFYTKMWMFHLNEIKRGRSITGAARSPWRADCGHMQVFTPCLSSPEEAGAWLCRELEVLRESFQEEVTFGLSFEEWVEVLAKGKGKGRWRGGGEWDLSCSRNSKLSGTKVWGLGCRGPWGAGVAAEGWRKPGRVCRCFVHHVKEFHFYS